MTVIRVGEIELDYERSGAGPPLLMIMGMSGSSLSWGEPFLEDLRQDFELIVYDHRGVGASTPLNGPITIREMAEDAAGLLAALEIDTAHVLGISMGGMIAQELALAHPNRIRTLAVGCTYCGGPGSVHIDEEALRPLIRARASGDRERILHASWEINVSPGYAQDPDAWARFVAIAIRRPVAIPVIAEQARAIAEHDTSGRLGEIATPTLVIHGSADQLLPVANGHMVAELIPGSQLEIFDGLGHLFFWERPERSADLLRAHAAVHA
jgi:3-oxoadipate enol-lactonase